MSKIRVYLDKHDGSLCYTDYPLIIQYYEIPDFRIVIPEGMTKLNEEEYNKIKEGILLKIPDLHLLNWHLHFNGRSYFSITIENDLNPGNIRVITEIKNKFL